MRKRQILGIALLAGLGTAQAVNSPLGEINIRLKGNVVDYACMVQAQDSDKVVPLGSWSTRQLTGDGSTTSLVPFTLRLTGCPPGSASLTFAGNSPSGHDGLLALNSVSTATQVAIELHDSDRQRLPLRQISRPVEIDANGDATLKFYANYISLAQNPTAGSANADATFVINYQ